MTAPGEAAQLAAEGLPDLVAALEHATGRPAAAMAAPRGAAVPPRRRQREPSMATPEKPVRAAALRYVKGDTAPALVASGRGYIAEAILQAAEEAGIPVREDGVLVEALAHLELGDQVPPSSSRRSPRRSCGPTGSRAAAPDATTGSDPVVARPAARRRRRDARRHVAAAAAGDGERDRPALPERRAEVVACERAAQLGRHAHVELGAEVPRRRGAQDAQAQVVRRRQVDLRVPFGWRMPSHGPSSVSGPSPAAQAGARIRRATSAGGRFG